MLVAVHCGSGYGLNSELLPSPLLVFMECRCVLGTMSQGHGDKTLLLTQARETCYVRRGAQGKKVWVLKWYLGGQKSGVTPVKDIMQLLARWPMTGQDFHWNRFLASNHQQRNGGGTDTGDLELG